MNAVKQVRSWRSFAIVGYGVIFMIFGIVGGWSAFFKIDQAAIAPGVVSVETNRKTVQHFEGGIVKEILVKEGDIVREGQLLFRLQRTQAEASSEVFGNQLKSALAAEARLMAERDQEEEITWPHELTNSLADWLDTVLSDQRAQFEQRRASQKGQIEVLNSRIAQLQTQIKGSHQEQVSAEAQVKLIQKELVGLHELAGKNLIPIARVYAMEREQARLEGTIGRAISDAAKAEAQISETMVQIEQVRRKFQEEVAAQLVDVRQKISELREKVAVARDVLARVDIVAPIGGSVQNLRVFTLGQVIRSGEPLLDIVPQNEPLVVSAHFSPNDIDGVYAGQSAEIRFPSFHGRTLPAMIGRLQSLSHDRMVDEQSREPYYLGVVSLERAQIPDEYRQRVRSGMHAEVIVALGERTVMGYLIYPLASSLRKSFREK